MIETEKTKLERAFYAGREMRDAKEKGMLFEHVYEEFTDYENDVLFGKTTSI